MKKNPLKNSAIELRRQGLPYSEIQSRISVPKSTLSHWLTRVRMKPDERRALRERQLSALRRGADQRKLKIRESIESIGKTSARDIKEISKRELWLLGVVLYWRERMKKNNESDIRRGVRFTSSDPELIKFFLSWLFEIGGLERGEILFDLFLHTNEPRKRQEAIAYWAHAVGFPPSEFCRIYFQKRPARKKQVRKSERAEFGLLRIRVRRSSLLARQIAGWIQGIAQSLSKMRKEDS